MYGCVSIKLNCVYVLWCIQTNDPLPQLMSLSLLAPQLNVTGTSMPGLPFVLSGHNSYVSWVSTTAAVDNADLLFESTVTASNRQRYVIRYNIRYSLM